MSRHHSNVPSALTTCRIRIAQVSIPITPGYPFVMHMVWTRMVLRGGLLTALSAFGPGNTGLSAQALATLTPGYPAIPPADSSAGADPHYSARLASAVVGGLVG